MFSQIANKNNMKDQDSISPIKPTSPMEVFPNNNYLDKLQDTEFIRTVINFVKQFKEFQEDMKNTFLNSKKIKINA